MALNAVAAPGTMSTIVFFLSKFILFFILKLSNSNDTQMAH